MGVAIQSRKVTRVRESTGPLLLTRNTNFGCKLSTLFVPISTASSVPYLYQFRLQAQYIILYRFRLQAQYLICTNFGCKLSTVFMSPHQSYIQFLINLAPRTCRESYQISYFMFLICSAGKTAVGRRLGLGTLLQVKRVDDYFAEGQHRGNTCLR